jgi:hypothetical protein
MALLITNDIIKGQRFQVILGQTRPMKVWAGSDMQSAWERSSLLTEFNNIEAFVKTGAWMSPLTDIVTACLAGLLVILMLQLTLCEDKTG